MLGVAAGGLIVLTNTKTVLESLGAAGVVVGLAAAVIFTLWVTGIAWAVKQERLARALADDRPLEPAPA